MNQSTLAFLSSTRTMKRLNPLSGKTSLLLALLTVTSISNAQLTSPALSCGPVFSGASFTIQYNGQQALLRLHDEEHLLQFVREWQTTMGDRWVDYQDKKMVVSTSWPAEPYVAISLQNAKNSMAACDVIEVKPQ